MNRREWLRAAALGLAASARGAETPHKVRVGAHIWMYSAKQPGYDPTPVLPQAFEELSKAEIDGVELMSQALMHDDAVPRIRELSKRYNLPIIGASWEAPMWDRGQRTFLTFIASVMLPRLQAIGGQRLGISVGDAHHKKSDWELDNQADFLRDLIHMCADHGIAPNLHNHVYEVQDNEYDLRGTLKRIPDVKLGPDVGWLFRAGINPPDFIREHRDRIVYMHLRDETAAHKWPDLIGEGVIDFAAIGKTLHEIGFSGDLAIELAHESDFKPVRSFGESVRLSREYVRRVMGY